MEKIVRLPFIDRLAANLERTPHLIQVILGPRQAGKTTTLTDFLNRDLRGKYQYESADKVFNADERWITEVWSKSQSDGKILVIDEIQKCENWSEVIKRLWDEKERRGKGMTCILLGSSSLELQTGLTESLTGRFQMIPVHHWNWAESREGYSLDFETYLKFGGYPGSYQMIGDEEWRRYVKNSIVATVVEKDILQNARVKSPSLFKQVFELLTSYPCHQVSYTKLLGQLQDKGNVDLIKHYISLYEGAFLVKSLEKYSTSKIKVKASSPKIIVLAPALYYLSILDDYTPEERGFAFEALVGAQLVRTGEDLFYWRTSKHEVDFVLKRGRNVWAIEVKSGRDHRAKSLAAFCKEYPTAIPVVVTKEDYPRFEADPMAFLRAF